MPSKIKVTGNLPKHQHASFYKAGDFIQNKDGVLFIIARELTVGLHGHNDGLILSLATGVLTPFRTSSAINTTGYVPFIGTLDITG